MENTNQHDELMQALFSAKERNRDLTMSIYASEIVSISNDKFPNAKTCTIQDSLYSLSMLGYTYSKEELSRVIELLNNIK